MVKELLAVAALLCFIHTNALANQVFKCTDSNGKLTFSDLPCEGSSEVLNIKDNQIGGQFHESGFLDQHRERRDKIKEIEDRYDRALRELNKGPCKSFTSTEVRTMVIRNQVVEGMKASDASKAWGQPTRINGDQHAYHWNKGGSSFFYVEQGCVSAVQGGYNG